MLFVNIENKTWENLNKIMIYQWNIIKNFAFTIEFIHLLWFLERKA